MKEVIILFGLISKKKVLEIIDQELKRTDDLWNMARDIVSTSKIEEDRNIWHRHANNYFNQYYEAIIIKNKINKLS